MEIDTCNQTAFTERRTLRRSPVEKEYSVKSSGMSSLLPAGIQYRFE